MGRSCPLRLARQPPTHDNHTHTYRGEYDSEHVELARCEMLSKQQSQQHGRQNGPHIARHLKQPGCSADDFVGCDSKECRLKTDVVKSVAESQHGKDND